MDLASVIGMGAGLFLIVGSILMGGPIGPFINIPSALIVIGGSISACLINFPISDVKGSIAVVKNAFVNAAAPPEKVIEVLVGFAEKARRDGLLALEKDLKETDNEFLRAGMELAIDGMDLDRIDALMSMELTLLAGRHKRGSDFFKQMAKYAPAFGMMGTLIGLVQMLQNVNDPSAIGPGMAVALITTFYGTLMANLICNPLAGKLETISDNEMLSKELILEGIKAIQAGDNPRMVERKLKTFLPPAIRDDLKLLGK